MIAKKHKPRQTVAKPPPIEIGDYFGYKGLHDFSVRLKTGVRDRGLFSDDSEHITQCATLEGAKRLAVLLNCARDLARDHHLVCSQTSQFGTRDQVAAYIARQVAQAVDTPFRYVSLEEHARDTLREYGRQVGDLARFFAFLDDSGTPSTLDEFKARAMLRRHAINDPSCSYCDHDRSREVARAWRRTFDPAVQAADRAARVLAELDAGDGPGGLSHG